MFIIDWGPFQFKHMPLGVINTPMTVSICAQKKMNMPMTLQRSIETIFDMFLQKQKQNIIMIIICLDDGTIYETTKKTHPTLRAILQMCQKHKVSLDFEKCMFLFFLGFLGVMNASMTLQRLMETIFDMFLE